MDTQQMVYRGDEALVHIPDGERVEVGQYLAQRLDDEMRDRAGDTGHWFPRFDGAQAAKPLCPGCYMVAVFNCAVALANDNGQSLTELGRSLACAFDALAKGGAAAIESIQVKLDSDEPCPVPPSMGNG